jgi:hypothetical protein
MMDQTYAQATSLRNADLATIAGALQSQRLRALDVVAPARSFRGAVGHLDITGTEPIIGDDGVTATEGLYHLTRGAASQLADMLGIPGQYAHRMLSEHPELWGANVNGWLDKDADRTFLLRLLRGDESGPAIVRAVLSPKYRIIDNLDVLLATLDGVRESGAEVEVMGADLSDRRMHVRISAPGIAAMAPNLLAGYRSPFTGANPAQRAGLTAHGYLAPGAEPIVFAGLVLDNSDTGNGAFTITPRLVVQICSNGLTITKDASRQVHLGGRLDEGTIKWSDDTQAAQLAVIRKQARDAVVTFLSQDYVESAITELEKTAGVEISNPVETITAVAKRLVFTETQAAGILDHFIKGAQPTAGGLLNAVTSYAQTLEDGDAAADMERVAVQAMELAAAASPARAGRHSAD